MKIWEDISEFKGNNPVLTIGSFDGVHLGHKKVIGQLVEKAKQVNGESVIFTFSPHPIRVLAPDKPFVLLTAIEEKIELFKELGVDHLILFPFTKAFSQLKYNEFVSQILVDSIHIHTLMVGHDNKIGKDREGSYEQLLELGEKYNFAVEKQEELKIEDNNISSTRIRELLSEGKLFDASQLLGYYYLLSGTVVKGQQLGNKLGFPTANVEPAENKFIPAIGVYAILVEYKNTTYKGMMNIGIRPTLEDNIMQPVVEAHLFNFKGNLYGEWIKISIIRKLRDEHKFESIDALRAQLKRDKDFAEETLSKEFGL